MIRSENTLKNAFHNNKRKEQAATKKDEPDEILKVDKVETPHRRAHHDEDGINNNDSFAQPRRRTARQVRQLDLSRDPVVRKIDMDETDEEDLGRLKCDLNTLALSAQALWTGIPSPSKVHGSINTKELQHNSPMTSKCMFQRCCMMCSDER